MFELTNDTRTTQEYPAMSIREVTPSGGSMQRKQHITGNFNYRIDDQGTMKETRESGVAKKGSLKRMMDRAVTKNRFSSFSRPTIQ